MRQSESYRKDANQRAAEAAERTLEATDKEEQRIRKDLNARQESIPAPVTPPPSGKVSLEPEGGGYLGLGVNASSGLYFGGFGTAVSIDQYTTELSLPFDEVTHRFSNPAASGGGGVSIGYTYRLPSHPLRLLDHGGVFAYHKALTAR